MTDIAREAQSNHLDKVIEILDYFESIEEDIPKRSLNEALKWTCLYGHQILARRLILTGADVNHVDEFGATPLHFAMKGVHESVLMELLNNNVDISSCHLNSRKLLHWSVQNGFHEVFNSLLERSDICVDEMDEDGNTILHVAVLHGQERILHHILCVNLLSVDVKNSLGLTSLHLACLDSLGNYRKIISILLSFGAEPQNCTPAGQTALLLSFESGRVNALIAEMTLAQTMTVLSATDDVSKGDKERSKCDPENIREVARQKSMSINRRSVILHPVNQGPMSLSDQPILDEKWWLGNHDDHKQMILSIWKRALMNDDVELVKIYRDTREMWFNPQSPDSFLRSQGQFITREDMRTLFFASHENGMGIYTYIEEQFADYIECLKFDEILQRLTHLRGFCALTVDKWIVFDSPSDHLVFLSLICGQIQLTEFLLRVCQFDLLPMTLLCVLILRKFILSTNAFSRQLSEALYRISENFEGIAEDAINRIFISDNSQQKRISIRLLQLPLKSYGMLSLLDLANRGNCSTFMSTACCQMSLEDCWFDRMYFLPWQVRWCLVMCPPIVWIPSITAMLCPKLNDESVPIVHVKSSIKPTRGNVSSSSSSGRPSYSALHLSFKQRIYALRYVFISPSVKFWYHSFVHLLFLGLFADVILSDFTYLPWLTEYFVLSFLVGYIFEKVHQIIRGFKKTDYLMNYWKNGWNYIDWASFICTATGFIIRLAKVTDPVAHENWDNQLFYATNDVVLYSTRIFYIIGFLLSSIRLLHIISMVRVLGPQLKMIGTMLKRDLLPVLPIFAVFIISFGVAFASLLYPEGQTNQGDGISRATIVGFIINRPFYGMFSVDSMLNGLPCSGQDTTCDFNQLGSYLILYLLYIIYVIIVNVTLINLLIALFANTVTRINQKSLSHWYAERYTMVEEYRMRSTFPPPINILVLLIKFVYFCRWRRTSHYEISSSKQTNMQLLINFFVIQTFTLRGQRYNLGLKHKLSSSKQMKGLKQASAIESIRNEVSLAQRHLHKLEKRMIKRLEEKAAQENEEFQTILESPNDSVRKSGRFAARSSSTLPVPHRHQNRLSSASTLPHDIELSQFLDAIRGNDKNKK